MDDTPKLKEITKDPEVGRIPLDRSSYQTGDAALLLGLDARTCSKRESKTDSQLI
jgi:hypothetical protein